MLIQKCDSPSLLSQALAEKRVSGDLAGVTALCYLMMALYNTAFSKSWPELQSILTFSTMLIQKCDSPSLLSQALAEKRVSGDFAGTTALYHLICALDNAKQAQKTIKRSLYEFVELLLAMSDYHSPFLAAPKNKKTIDHEFLQKRIAQLEGMKTYIACRPLAVLMSSQPTAEIEASLVFFGLCGSKMCEKDFLPFDIIFYGVMPY